MNRHIEIEVVYALPGKQVVRPMRVPDETTAEQAVRLSGMLELFPEIDLSLNKLGVFGKAVKPGRILRDSDRVEIYRPLAVDPREARRRRAKETTSTRPQSQRAAKAHQY